MSVQSVAPVLSAPNFITFTSCTCSPPGEQEETNSIPAASNSVDITETILTCFCRFKLLHRLLSCVNNPLIRVVYQTIDSALSQLRYTANTFGVSYILKLIRLFRRNIPIRSARQFTVFQYHRFTLIGKTALQLHFLNR